MSAVTYESLDRVAVVTIDQPEKRNALSREVVNELAEVWRRFAVSSDRVAVLTATGDKAFTVGADLNDIPHDLWRGVPGIGVEIGKPIVGAVAGWVVGGRSRARQSVRPVNRGGQHDVPLSRSQGRLFRRSHIVARRPHLTWCETLSNVDQRSY